MAAAMDSKVRRKGRLHEEHSARPEQLGDSVEVPEYCAEAAVDIIAIHGLASKYESTWSIELEDGRRYHWLREKLGFDIPQARILGYEYGSEWYGDPTYTNLEECGAEFLRCIIRDRRHQGRPEMCPARRKRPIIFVAHSFGGLVVKQALVTAYRTWKKGDNANSLVKETVRRAQAANYRDFLCSVAGVIFLGTPHRGSVFSNWANVKMIIGSLMGRSTHPELVKVLSANSEPLLELQQAFEDACNDRTLLDILPHCYRETRQVALPPYIVVRAESAYLDHAENAALDANHMEMNKFHLGADANYDKVLSDIQQMFSLAARSVSRRLEKWRYGSPIAEDDRNMVEHRLDPSRTPQIRHFQSKLASHQAAPYTCQWLQQQDCYKAWESGSGNHNVLWVHGKPASGKSVLAAYAINALRTSAETMTASNYSPCHNPLSKRACGSKNTKSTVLYFFCGVDQGHDMPQGLLGTLIHQLLTIHDTDEMMFATAHRWKDTTPVTKINGTTSMELLRELLSLVFSPVFIVIGGLDHNLYAAECVQHLQIIASARRSNNRLLILSQRHEVLRKTLEQSPTTVGLSIIDHSQLDILQYIEHKTRQLLEHQPTFEPKRDTIIQKLQSQVGGIFELVNTAMHGLENHVAHVDSVDDYLANLPSSLKSVYNKIFVRLNRNHGNAQTRIRIALQFLAVSAVPITVLDLQTALEVSRSMKDGGKEGPWRSKWSTDEQADASRRLISLLDSLIEIDSDYFVTLVHPSLRRTLLTTPFGSSDTSRSNSDSWYQFSATEAHLLVSEICVAVCGDTTLSQAHALTDTQPSLVAYAWKYWAYHLRASGCPLKSDASRLAFDRMLRHVHQHTLFYLSELGEFVSKPLEPVRGNYTVLEYCQSLQRAQGSLSLAIDALCQARQSIPVAAKLHKARARVLVNLSDLPMERKYQRAMKWMKSTASRLRNWLLRDQTNVARVNLDNLIEQTAIDTIFNGTTFPVQVPTLLNASRSLRLTALSFSVNPLHAALVQNAGSSGFSPINLLVTVAQLLEQAASFPYWHHLPEMLDSAEAFLCSTSDPQAEPARFVVRSLDQLQPNKRLAAAGIEISSEQVSKASSEELGRQIWQLSEVTAHRWVAARYASEIFRFDGDGDDGWFQTLVANPLSNLYLKDKLFMLGEGKGRWPIFLSPAVTLDLRAPMSMRDAPFGEIVKAIPAMLKLAYIKYVITLLELFAEVPRTSVAAHFVQLTTSQGEMLECARYAKRFCTTILRRWRQVPVVLLLYWLRRQFCPWLGAHAMVHPWADLLLSNKHPAAYLNFLSVHDAKFWLKYKLTMQLYNAIGRTFVVYSQAASDSIPDHMFGLFFSDTLAGLYHVIMLERNLFGLGFALAVLTASAKVILYDPENLSAVGRFTFWYVVVLGSDIFNLSAGALLQQNRATFLQGLAVVTFEVAVLVGLVTYRTTALRILAWILSWAVWPIKGPATTIWNLGLYIYAPFLKFCGILVFIGMVLLAMAWLDKNICDPHDLEGSRKAVSRAVRKIASMPDQSIGEFPVGSSSVPASVTDGEKDRDSSGYNSWAWSEDLREKVPVLESPEPSLPPQATHGEGEGEHVSERNIHSDLEKFGDAAASEFGKGFEQILQTIPNMNFDSAGLGSSSGNLMGMEFWGGSHSYSSISDGHFGTDNALGRMDDFDTFMTNTGQSDRHNRRFRYPSRNSLPRNDHVNYDSYRDTRGNGWSSGGQRPGDPFTGLSYSDSSTGPPHWWDYIFLGFVFAFLVAVLAYIVWGWWTGRLEPVSTEPVATCWHIGIPLGPIYVGYGCDGFFWEILSYSGGL